MARLHEVTLAEVVGDLPAVQSVSEVDFQDRRDDIFLCALGFEDRCPVISETAAKIPTYKVGACIYFEYNTNIEDNEANRSRLTAALGALSEGKVYPLGSDAEDFAASLRVLIKQCSPGDRMAKITFDVSVCSSKLLITVLTTLIDFGVELRVLYVEANVYHPTMSEYEERERLVDSDGFGQEHGVGNVAFSREHPGVRSDQVAEAVIIFPTFKPERTRAVLAAIDEDLLEGGANRVVWIVGKPHLPSDYWRAQAMRKINSIPQDCPCYEISTFDYMETLQYLERVYELWQGKFNISISPLGSKMQCVGTALFWYLHQDTSFVFSSPERYNARSYSEGSRALWKLDLGALPAICEVLDRVGQLEVIG